MTEKVFLLNTIKYYSENPKHKRNKINGISKYESLKETSDGCPIGRFLSIELKRKMDNLPYPDISDIKSKNNDIFNQLPEWIQKMDINFLQEVSELHDVDDYWDDNGLSYSGKFFINCIIQDYNLDIPFLYTII